MNAISAVEADIELVWRCGDCGYQALADRRPATCHGCRAGGSVFKGMTAVAWRRELALARILGPAPAPTRRHR